MMTSVRLPREFETRRLVKRSAVVAAALLVVVLVVVLAPGLGEVRHRLEGASPGWMAVAVGFEALSCVSYVLMFKPIFCSRMSWRTTAEIATSELGVGSILPASGAGGLALGAWILSQGGMPADQIARRSVAFFVIKSSVNFIAVAVLGYLLALGIVGPSQPLWLTAAPATLATMAILGVLAVPRLRARPPLPDDPKARRWVAHALRALVGGTVEAISIVRRGEALVIIGAIGYWAWDNLVLWATFHAMGVSPPITVILMGYLIGQLGGLLPIPGGLGGIDGGLLGTLIVYGTPAAPTVAAVLGYRVILFWLPLIAGAIAFSSLRKGLNDPNRWDLCIVPEPVRFDIPSASGAEA
jgi:uncharacterized membrane protein YbhN (UPF0104 family)